MNNNVIQGQLSCFERWGETAIRIFIDDGIEITPSDEVVLEVIKAKQKAFFETQRLKKAEAKGKLQVILESFKKKGDEVAFCILSGKVQGNFSNDADDTASILNTLKNFRKEVDRTLDLVKFDKRYKNKTVDAFNYVINTNPKVVCSHIRKLKTHTLNWYLVNDNSEFKELNTFAKKTFSYGKLNKATFRQIVIFNTVEDIRKQKGRAYLTPKALKSMVDEALKYGFILASEIKRPEAYLLNQIKVMYPVSESFGKRTVATKAGKRKKKYFNRYQIGKPRTLKPDVSAIDLNDFFYRL